MYAVTVCTYGGFTEHWSDDYRLTVEYSEPRSFEMTRIDGVWRCSGAVSDEILRYLQSAAEVQSCLGKSASIENACSLVPAWVLPEELLRCLLDERGMEIEPALALLLSVFGEGLCENVEKPWLKAVQPRCHALTAVLNKEIRQQKLLLHKPYDKAFRSPVGSVPAGESVTLSVLCPNAEAVRLSVQCEDFQAELPMQRCGNIFTATFTPGSAGAYFYRFTREGAKTEEFQLTVYERGFETPEWFREGIMYQVFPDRFGLGEDVTEGIEYHKRLGQTPQLHESAAEPVKWRAREGEKAYAPDDFYGGTLRGIEKRLPYLKELGVSVLYLNPIVEARSNHRYDTSDYERPDPILGSVEDYANLCKTAAGLGIRVINDGVFSHTGADSRYFDRYGNYGGGACEGQTSAFYDWYDFERFPDKYRCWWGFEDLPEVNELDPAWQDYIISGEDSIVKRWLRYGASGWRLDVADELPEEALELIRSAVKAEKPDAVIIGEVWEDAVTKESYGKRRTYALGGSLDSVMNYPLRTAILDFALGRTTAFALAELLRHQKYDYPAPMHPALMNLLGTHDVERLHTVLSLGHGAEDMSRAAQAEIKISPEDSERGTRLQKLCAAILYSIPGVPCLYYGDEECLDGLRDPFNRAPFEPTRGGLFGYYAKLGALRNAYPALRHGTYEVEVLSDDVLCIHRDELTCVVNRGETAIDYPGRPLLGNNNRVEPLSAEIFTE